MMNLSPRFKSAMLVFAMMTTSHVAHAFSVQSITDNVTPAKAAFFFGVASWIRLKTKGSSWDYKLSDWKEDVRDLMDNLNIFDAELYSKLVALFDKYAIGRQVSILDRVTTSKNEIGATVKLKDKKLQAAPFGVVGLVDAYVISQLEAVGKIASNWDSSKKLYNKVVVNVVNS